MTLRVRTRESFLEAMWRVEDRVVGCGAKGVVIQKGK